MYSISAVRSVRDICYAGKASRYPGIEGVRLGKNGVPSSGTMRLCNSTARESGDVGRWRGTATGESCLPLPLLCGPVRLIPHRAVSAICTLIVLFGNDTNEPTYLIPYLCINALPGHHFIGGFVQAGLDTRIKDPAYFCTKWMQYDFSVSFCAS